MMEKVLMIVTAALGLCAVSIARRRYQFIYERKNFSEALLYCREKYTDLATVDTLDDVNTLSAMADLIQMYYTDYPQYSNRAWLGLYDHVNSWRWSLSDASFYKNKEAEFRMWNLKEPNNLHSGEHCAQIYNTGFWNDDHCGESFKAICSDVKGQSVRFVPTYISMSWLQAQNYCRSHYTDLASVRNMSESKEVAKWVTSNDRVWIGLFRDSWKWVDGSYSSFRYWKNAEPNNKEGDETCVSADFGTGGQWEDFKCDYRKPFICYTAVSKHVIKMKALMQSPSLNPNDPAVLQDTLKQLKQKLKDHGVNEDITLSWNKHLDGKVFHKADKLTKKTDTVLKRDEF